MTQKQYISERDELVSSFDRVLAQVQDDALNNQFNLVSAGLLNFLPEIGFEQHRAIFRDILLNQQLSWLEQSAFAALDFLSCEGISSDVVKVLSGRPAIICTFHTGSYRLLNLLLVTLKVRYSLVIARTVVEQQGGVFAEAYNKITGQNGKDSGFSIIDAEDGGSGLKMLRNLKAGRCLVIYIDGNTGAGKTEEKNDNCCTIEFLHQRLVVRKGIAHLSHTAQVPILPVYSYRRSLDDIRLRFLDPVLPEPGKDRSGFAQETTQTIFQMIAPVITRYPEQWETWLYIHKMAKMKNSDQECQGVVITSGSDINLFFNSTLFGIFRISGTAFLFRKKTYTSYEIDDNLYLLFACSEETPFPVNQVDSSFLIRLCNEGVLRAR